MYNKYGGNGLLNKIGTITLATKVKSKKILMETVWSIALGSRKNSDRMHYWRAVLH